MSVINLVKAPAGVASDAVLVGGPYNGIVLLRLESLGDFIVHGMKFMHQYSPAPERDSEGRQVLHFKASIPRPATAASIERSAGK